MLDKTANIFPRKGAGRALRRAGSTSRPARRFRRPSLSHFLLASPEASQSNPLLRNDRGGVPGSVRARVHARAAQGLPHRGERAPRVPARRDDHRRVGRRHRHQPVRSSPVAWRASRRRAAGRLAAPASSRCTSRVSSRQSTASPTALSGALPPNITVTHLADDLLVKTRFVDRDNGYRLFEGQRARICRTCGATGCRTSTTTMSCWSPTSAMVSSTPRRSTRRTAGRRRSFVTAMAQVNSSNYGYNLPT